MTGYDIRGIYEGAPSPFATAPRGTWCHPNGGAMAFVRTAPPSRISRRS